MMAQRCGGRRSSASVFQAMLVIVSQALEACHRTGAERVTKLQHCSGCLQVEKGAIVAAGALVTPGTVIPSGQQPQQFCCSGRSSKPHTDLLLLPAATARITERLCCCVMMHAVDCNPCSHLNRRDLGRSAAEAAAEAGGGGSHLPFGHIYLAIQRSHQLVTDEIWTGWPAKLLRKLKEADAAFICLSAGHIYPCNPHLWGI